VLGGALSDDAEGEVEAYVLAELVVELLHSGGYDEQDVGQVGVPGVYEVDGPLVGLVVLDGREVGVEGEGVVLALHLEQVLPLSLKDVGGGVGVLKLVFLTLVEELSEGDLILRVDFASDGVELSLSDAIPLGSQSQSGDHGALDGQTLEILLHCHGGVMFFVLDPEHFEVVGLISVDSGCISGRLHEDFSDLLGVLGVHMVVPKSDELVFLLEGLVLEVDQFVGAELAVCD